jgi:hypothetical protein
MRPVTRFVHPVDAIFAIQPRMDIPRNRQSERVRQILSTRGLTFYRASQRSAEMFGRSSPFYLPHNLHYDLAVSAATPSLYQLIALSRITRYRLSDWLAVFGFDLDAIPRLQVLVSRRRTVILDSAVYDTEAWLPWFSERSGAADLGAMTPLGQLLSPARPERARELLSPNKTRFLYAKVGQEDSLAFPDIGPGSIIRVDTGRAHESPVKNSADKRVFLVEYDLGFACSRLSSLGNGRVVFRSPQLPFAEGGFSPGKDLRIVGVIDAELRPLPRRDGPVAHFAVTAAPSGQRLARNGGEMNFKQLIRRSRVRAGLSFREASKLSRWVAGKLGDSQYFTAASTLSDYETLSVVPRHTQKIITLCILYALSFADLLRAGNLVLEENGAESIPDKLLRRANLPSERKPGGSRETNARKQSRFFEPLLERWQEVPLFLRRSLSELARVPNFSVSDVFWVGQDHDPIHPWLRNAEFVTINRRIKKPASSKGATFWEQPLYVLLTRDGRYLCGCCTLERGIVVVHPYPDRPFIPRQFKNGTDAEVVGEVTAILRRLA